MKGTTRFWRQRNLDLLRKFKTAARKQAWILKKDGYIVDFYDRYKQGSCKLKINQIYNYEKIVVFEFNGTIWNKVINDISYDSLTQFYLLVQRYKKAYGKKDLHKYTGEIIARISK